jgi:hypothetical protein
MATLSEIAAELNDRMRADGGAGFGNDWAGFYDISDEEAQRIAERSKNAAEFEARWQDADWWTDDNNA